MPTQENVIAKTSDFITWFLPKIEKFPRNYKFLLGDRLVEIQLNLLERLIEAYYGILCTPGRAGIPVGSGGFFLAKNFPRTVGAPSPIGLQKRIGVRISAAHEVSGSFAKNSLL